MTMELEFLSPKLKFVLFNQCIHIILDMCTLYMCLDLSSSFEYKHYS
jgi:hypothetical protein